MDQSDESSKGKAKGKAKGKGKDMDQGKGGGDESDDSSKGKAKGKGKDKDKGKGDGENQESKGYSQEPVSAASQAAETEGTRAVKWQIYNAFRDVSLSQEESNSLHQGSALDDREYRNAVRHCDEREHWWNIARFKCPLAQTGECVVCSERGGVAVNAVWCSDGIGASQSVGWCFILEDGHNESYKFYLAALMYAHVELLEYRNSVDVESTNVSPGNEGNAENASPIRNVTVRSTAGEVLWGPSDVQPQMLIADFLPLLAEALRVPPNSIKLVHGEEVLKDTSFGLAGISDGAALVAVMDPDPCPTLIDLKTWPTDHLFEDAQDNVLDHLAEEYVFKLCEITEAELDGYTVEQRKAIAMWTSLFAEDIKKLRKDIPEIATTVLFMNAQKH